MNSLIDRLTAAHRILSAEIAREVAKRRPDAVRLARLKKEKLAVKDRLHRHAPGDPVALLRAVGRSLRRTERRV